MDYSLIKDKTVCFTGKRPKDLYGYYQNSFYKYDYIVNHLIDNVLPALYEDGYRYFITGGAQGFDQLVFEAVDTFKHTHPDIQNIIFAPCLNQESLWAEGEIRFTKGYYRHQIAMADVVEYVTNRPYTTTCLTARNEAMINASSAVVCLFKAPIEQAKKSNSGTEHTICYAVEQPDYKIYQMTYDFNDASFFEDKTYTSEEVRELRKRQIKERNDNVLIVNPNPVPPIPEGGFGDKICFDTETTGFSYDIFDELLQIAVVGSNGNEYTTYIKPDKKKNWKGAESVNHISPETVKNAPSARNVMAALQPYFDNATTIIGHNIDFDINFVTKAGLNLDNKIKWDTCSYFKNDIPEGKHKLEMAVETYCPDFIDEYKEGAHDALTDTRATMEVFKAQEQKEKDSLLDLDI